MTRVYNKAPHELLPGEYDKWDGKWFGIPPGTDLIANLARHKIEEHADGTITVSPSIIVSDGNEQWHGFLTHGEWKPC